MSASLVGSEMCIRDSACPARPLGSEAGPASPTQTRLACPAPVLTWLRAVSYTHLTLPTICSV
eukprot:5600710-Alexandrium_andersonii.AAC.1